MRTFAPTDDRFNDNLLHVADETLTATRRRGGNWCFWIAGLTLINPTVSIRGGEISFGLGLTFTKIAEALVHGTGGPAHYAPVLVNLLFAAVLVTFGILGSNGRTWAIVAGTVIYALDGLLLVGMVATGRVPGGYLAFIIYVVALYNLYQGLNASYKLSALRSGRWRPGSPPPNLISVMGRPKTTGFSLR